MSASVPLLEPIVMPRMALLEWFSLQCPCLNLPPTAIAFVFSIFMVRPQSLVPSTNFLVTDFRQSRDLVYSATSSAR